MDSRDSNADAVRLPHFGVTYALVGLIVAIAVVQAKTGLDRSIWLAGQFKEAVREGEYWRLLTGPLLHGGLAHIAFNSLALRGFGREVEMLAGRWTLPAVMLVSMLAGSLCSQYFLPMADSVGASGGIVGLLGFLIVLGYRYRSVLHPQFRNSLLQNVFLLIVMGILARNKIDNAAHAGGFVAGAIFGLIGAPPRLTSWPARETGAMHAAGVFSITVIFGFGAYAVSKLLRP
jgi:membrane associated rhomboid family serine protease